MYWFDKPYAKEILKSLSIAKKLYEQARFFWNLTKRYVEEAWKYEQQGIRVDGDMMQYLQDVAYKIHVRSDPIYKHYIRDYYYTLDKYKAYPEYNYDRVLDKLIGDINRKEGKIRQWLK